MDAPTDPSPTRERRRRRSQDVAPTPPRSERYRQLVNPFEPARVLSDDHVEAIHEAAIRILTEVGIRVLHPEARSLLAEAGARVDESEQHVFIDSDLIASSMAAAPSRFDLRSRTGGRDVAMGGNVGRVLSGCGSTQLDGSRPLPKGRNPE